MLLSLTTPTRLCGAAEKPVWRGSSTSWSWSTYSSLLCSGVSLLCVCVCVPVRLMVAVTCHTWMFVNSNRWECAVLWLYCRFAWILLLIYECARFLVTVALVVAWPSLTCQCINLQNWSQAMFFICMYNGLQAILEECRQQLGRCVNHQGLAGFVGALFSLTICDHPLKSLLIYCRCLFSEIPGLSLGPASVLISQLGLSSFCKEKAICEMKRHSRSSMEM